MSEGTAAVPLATGTPASAPATPGVPSIASPRLKPLNEPAPSLVTVNSLAEDVWDEIERDGLASNQGKERLRESREVEERGPQKPKQPKSEPARESDEGPRDNEGEEADPEAGDEEQVPHDEPQDTWGTEKEPYKLSDLPEDKFVKVKVDGDWKVVPLREAVAGGIREETFSRRVNQARQVMDEARQIATQSREKVARLGQAVHGLMNDPQRLFTRLLENHPDVLHQVAVKFAHHNHRVKNEPGYEARVTRAIYENKLRAQQEEQQRQRQEQEQQSAAAAEQKRIQETLRPGYDAGLKEAGFPKQTPEFKRHLRREIAIIQEDLPDGQELNADHVKQAVLTVAKFLNLPKGTDAKPRKFEVPRPAGAMQTPAKQTATTKKKPSWNGMAQHEKVRSTDFLFENSDLSGFLRGGKR